MSVVDERDRALQRRTASHFDPHSPQGSVVGQMALMTTMPIILEYVGGGLGLPRCATCVVGSTVHFFNFLFIFCSALGGASHGNGISRAPRSQIPGISAPKRDINDDDFKMKGLPGIAK